MQNEMNQIDRMPKKNPLSFQIDLSKFEKATDEEKKQQDVMSESVPVKKSRHKKYFFLFHFFKSGHTSHFGPFVFFKSRHDMHFLLFFFF